MLTLLSKLMADSCGDPEFWAELHETTKAQHDRGYLSFAAWNAILDNAVNADAATVDKQGRFGTVAGLALFKRWLWAREMRAKGHNPAHAEEIWNERIDRVHGKR